MLSSNKSLPQSTLSQKLAALQQTHVALQEQHQQLLEQHKDYHETLQSKESFIQAQREEIEQLRYQLNYYLKHRYGRSQDQVPDGQLSLFDEDALPDVAEDTDDATSSQVTVKGHQRKPQTKKPLPNHLPRIRQEVDVADSDKACQGCGHALHRIGEDVSEKLDIIPAQFRVIEVVRPKYGCRHCETGVTQASLPSQALPKCQVTPGLLAHILVNKYVDHLPLYRQEKILARTGLDIPRNTLCDWVLKCAEAITPLWELLYQQMQRSDYIQADETPVQVLGKPPSRHFMWCYRGYHEDKPLVLYDYHASRGGDIIRTFLKDFKGWLQSDGYAAYHQVPCQGHAACWAHVRRKYVDVIKCSSKTGIASNMVALMNQLYAIEKQAREQTMTSTQRQQLRQSQAPSILNAIKDLLTTHLQRVPPKSPLGRAMIYHHKLGDKLTCYVEQGRVEIDNNLVENAIRPFALGRRNWLFQGNARGAKAASVLYSLIMTCQANQIEPYAYFKAVLYQLPKINPSDYPTLLPFNINPEQLEEAY